MIEFQDALIPKGQVVDELRDYVVDAITIRDIITGAPGSLAEMTLTKVAEGNYVLDVSIPRGDTGDITSELQGAAEAAVAAMNAAEASAVSADGSAAAAAQSKTGAETAIGAAQTARDAAIAARTGAETAQTGAQTSAADAETARIATATLAAAAVTAFNNAEAARAAAVTAKTASETARDASIAGKTASEAARDASVAAKTGSETARTGSETARDQAVTAKTASEAARDQSVTAKTASETARDAAIAAKTGIETAQTAAAASATAADASKTAAAGSATAAQTARIGAETARTGSEAAQTAAGSSATAAAASATAAEGFKTAAAGSAAAAAADAGAIAGSVGAADAAADAAGAAATIAETARDSASAAAIAAGTARTGAETARDASEDFAAAAAASAADAAAAVDFDPSQYYDKAASDALFADKADLVGGKVPTSQLPAIASTADDVTETTARVFVSPTQRTKLDGIAAGAEVNVQSDWTAGSGDAFIANKPTSFPPSTHVHAISDVTGLSTALDDKAPSSHVGAGGTAHAEATTSAAGFMSATDKTKLGGVAAGANNYVHPTADGSRHVPATGTTNSGKFLKAGATASSEAWAAIVQGDVTGLAAALADKAPLASPALSGTPTAPTAAPGTNSTQLATTEFAQTLVNSLISAAPSFLDTFDEIAAAIGDDPNFVTTMMTALSGKAATVHSHSDATTGASGFMSASDKTKLNGVAAGATANIGTVTSVALSAPTGLSVSNSPLTTSGTLTLTYASGYQGYTSAEATKLAGIAAGAQVNSVTSVAGRDGAVTLTTADVSGVGAETISTGTPSGGANGDKWFQV